MNIGSRIGLLFLCVALPFVLYAVDIEQNAVIYDSSLSNSAAVQGLPAEDAATVLETVNDLNETSSESSFSIVKHVTAWYKDHLNYGTIALLMTVESSFIPFPSEAVIPPAAFWACQADSPLFVTSQSLLNVFMVVLAGTIGAIIGAMINYFLSIWLGRMLIYKFADSRLGHLCLLSSEKVKKAEQYFLDHGKTSTFIGRLVPAVRQLISIPAGLSKMPLGAFLMYTFLGAFIWNIFLAIFGYVAHGQQDLIDQYSHEISMCMLGVGVLFVIYLGYKSLKKKKATC